MLDLDVAEGGENLATSLLVFKPNGERVKLDTELAELIRSKKNKDIVNVLRRNTGRWYGNFSISIKLLISCHLHLNPPPPRLDEPSRRAASTAPKMSSLTSSFRTYELELRAMLSSKSSPTQLNDVLKSLKLERSNCSNRPEANAIHSELKLACEKFELLAGSTPSSSSNPTKLSAINSKLTKQQGTIDRIRQSVAEMEDVGGGISSNLASNREAISRSKDRVAGVNEQVGYAGKIAEKMSKWWA